MFCRRGNGEDMRVRLKQKSEKKGKTFGKKWHQPSVAMPNISFKVLISEIQACQLYTASRVCAFAWSIFYCPLSRSDRKKLTFIPVRSFSRNWIRGKTILSAIWLASSEWSAFSWNTHTRDSARYSVGLLISPSMQAALAANSFYGSKTGWRQNLCRSPRQCSSYYILHKQAYPAVFLLLCAQAAR